MRISVAYDLNTCNMSFCITWSIFAVALSILYLRSVQALERDATYTRSTDLDGLSCLTSDVAIDEESRSAINCLKTCMDIPCETLFYNKDTRVCSGCTTWYANSVIDLPLSPGTIAYRSSQKSEDCKELYDIGNHDSGVYRIFPAGSGSEGIQVRCDMTTPPGGWTIIQRRIDGSDFYKTWSEYKAGFGDLFGSYWLGNDYIWQLTSNKQYRLRFDLTAQDGETGWAEYDDFSIEDETLQYAVNIGVYTGDVGNSFSTLNGMKFTTNDMDNDIWNGRNCAVEYHGAWWYSACHSSNLNGDYMNTGFGLGMNWDTWRGLYESLIESEMKIYPS